jgi:phosphate uptake regulator
MEFRRQSQLLRSHLLKMAMVSHRAVDYSIKAYEVGNIEFGRLVRIHEKEWRRTQHSIGERGRRLSATGMPVDSDSRIARHTIRIYSALRITHLAATEIAHNSTIINESGRPLVAEGLRPMGRFVNGLVGLYSVALFNMELRHAKTILACDQGRRWFYGSLALTEKSLLQQTGAGARSELAIAKSLGQIADQAYEIAEAFRSCFDGEDCLGGGIHERAA